ncbi:hypothetical protein FJ964_20020 [Mesorhizobium sp. B2-3-2]|nr:hypothetical protein FJ964_20020 [Mesorhizobium sp. B2-3-2]
MGKAGGARPPLACRPSPPQGGRSAVCSVFANSSMLQEKAMPVTPPIFPLEGEMSGRTEGGVQALTEPG